jgi:PAB-dependent poly(A)-specific ribonuclease subunit 3
MDAIQHSSFSTEAVESVLEQQRQDIQAMGGLLGRLIVGGDLNEVVDLSVMSGISTTLMDFLNACALGSATAASLTEKIGYLYAFKAEQMTTSHDRLLAEMRKATEVGRVMQLLVKINSILDRTALVEDWRWSQSSERHLVQLFRDYLFFQSDEFGRPILDTGHVMDALAKADIGSTEAIMLIDRDASSVLVVSFMDIRRCIDTSFKQVTNSTGYGQLQGNAL